MDVKPHKLLKLKILIAAGMYIIFLAIIPSCTRASVINKSASSTASGLTNTDLNSGLVGYWPFDGKYITWLSATVGTSTDASGNGNNGTLLGMNRATSTVAGKIGQALAFNGSTTVSSALTAYVDVPTLPNQTNAYTMSAWVYPKLANENSRGIMGKGTLPTGFNMYGGTNDNVFCTNVNATTPTLGIMFSVNKWTFLTCIWNGSTLTLYVNTASTTSVTTSGIPAGTTDFFVGRAQNNGLYIGNIDDVRVYNRALSSQEMAQLYHFGLTTIDKSDTGLTNNDLGPANGFATSTSGITAYYPFDGKYMTWSSSTVGTSTDATGNTANNAKLVSMNRALNVVAGRDGQALKFDGATTFAQAPSSIISTGANSVCAWIKQTSFVGTANAVIANTKFIFFTSSTNNTIALTSDGTTNAVSATNAIVNGVWQFVCGTRDATGANSNIYVNGNLSGTANQNSGTPTSSTFNNDIGAKGNGIADFFSGSIDDVRVYGRVLSATEIKQLYNETGGDIVNKSDTGLTNTDLNSGLVGYWPFDGKYITWLSATVGTSTDASGNGNNGTLLGMNRATSTVAGKIGQALSFNGTTTYVDIPSITANPTTGYTLSAWVYSKTQSQLSNGILGKGLVTNGFILAGGSNNDAVCYGANSNTSSVVGSVPLGKWTFVTCVWNGSILAVYINAASSTSISLSTAPSGSTDFFIGKFQNHTLYNGYIDDARYYNRALSTTEITQLYDMGR